MKMYRAKNGIFDWRVFYEDDEMDTICLDALISVDLLPTSPGPIRIDRFLKKKFGVDAEYMDLPDGTLGFTKFGEGGVERIVIAEKLDMDQSVSAARRINTTMAHEAGHGLFHSRLFNFQPRLFVQDDNDKTILCREELRQMISTGHNTYNGEWWEFQANVAIGSLLLPRPLVIKCLKDFICEDDSFIIKLNESKFEDAVACLSEVFDVNQAVSRIRIREIFPKTQQRAF